MPNGPKPSTEAPPTQRLELNRPCPLPLSLPSRKRRVLRHVWSCVVVATMAWMAPVDAEAQGLDFGTGGVLLPQRRQLPTGETLPGQHLEEEQDQRRVPDVLRDVAGARRLRHGGESGQGTPEASPQKLAIHRPRRPRIATHFDKRDKRWRPSWKRWKTSFQSAIGRIAH